MSNRVTEPFDASRRREDLDALVAQEASAFAAAVAQAADEAANERELQNAVTALLTDFASRANVDLLSREEYTLAEGRADAVYNRLVIEYEAPGSIRPNRVHGRTVYAFGQAKQYMTDLAASEGHDLERLLGVVADGRLIGWIRFAEGRWDIETPIAWDVEAAARLLSSVVALSSGRALIPDNIVTDFGLESPVFKDAVSALYEAISTSNNELAQALYAQWSLLFSEASDYTAGEADVQSDLGLVANNLGLESPISVPRLLFAVHSYFSLVAKSIARLVVARHLGHAPGMIEIADSDEDVFVDELRRMEVGQVFADAGIENLLEGDLFSWYLACWSPRLSASLRAVTRKLAIYNPATVEDDPYAARDLLKKLYHYLLPREIRHDLGEFYTPDWLARHVLAQLNDPLWVRPEGDSISDELEVERRLVDPACGSGTFLILAIAAFKANTAARGIAPSETLRLITSNIYGFDLNPLAVLACRVGYVLAIADLLPHRDEEVVIPVFLADTIVIPGEGRTLLDDRGRQLDTVVATFPIPDFVTDARALRLFTSAADTSVHAGESVDEFAARVEAALDAVPSEHDKRLLAAMYERLAGLHAEGRNGVWARFIRNSFMPLFAGKFDYVVGNPPWVNWEHLPDSYRERTRPLWEEFGLVGARRRGGRGGGLGSARVDVSTLMTVVAADHFLARGGKIAFVITQSVFKNDAGRGFRRFRLPGSVPLQVTQVDDMTDLQPFEGASTRTAVFVAKKGSETEYPVPYVVWRKSVGDRFNYESSPEAVTEATTRTELVATPVASTDATSAWLTVDGQVVDAAVGLFGQSHYHAHVGVCGWANGVYWVQTVGDAPDGRIVVQNCASLGKRSVPEVTGTVEPEFLFDLVRPRDISRWTASPELSIIVPYDRDGRVVPERVLKDRYPGTWGFLSEFESLLRSRAGYRQLFERSKGPFYSVMDVGAYTFAPYKVCWPRIASEINACVVERSLVPQETVTLVDCATLEEAHYVCGMMNSALFRFAARAYSQVGAKSFAAPHVLDNIELPRFSASNPAHKAVATLAKQAAGGGETPELRDELDTAAGAVMGLTAKQLKTLLASPT